jgi:hypothetical protein
MNSLESIENIIFTTDSLEKILDERTYNSYEDENVLCERLSNSLARIYFATYKNKIDKVFKQLKSK